MQAQGMPPVNDEDINRVLIDLEERLSNCGRLQTTASHGLPAPNRTAIPNQVPLPLNANPLPREVREALNFDKTVEARKASFNKRTMNTDQLSAFTDIAKSMDNDLGCCYFVNAFGGSGKTWLANTLLAYGRGKGHICLATASSGIAAILLDHGRTMHSTMAVPVKNLNETSTCNISANQGKAELMRRAKLIVWDEAVMNHRWMLEAIDRTLRDLRQNSKPFGGVTFVLAGDWRQVLPIIPRANRAQIVGATLRKSPLWKHFKEVNLTINERVKRASCVAAADSLKVWGDYLLAVGDGRVKVVNSIGPDTIRLPDSLLLRHPDGNYSQNIGGSH